MDCQEIRKIALRYCQNKLSNKEKEEIEKHLCSCSSCQTYIKNVQSKILPYLNTYIYPLPEDRASINHSHSIQKKKQSGWNRLIPNILTAISLLLIIIAFALAQKILTKH